MNIDDFNKLSDISKKKLNIFYIRLNYSRLSVKILLEIDENFEYFERG